MTDLSKEAVERHIAQNPQLLPSTIEMLRALAAKPSLWQPIRTAPRDGTAVVVVNMKASPDYRMARIAGLRYGTPGEPQPRELGWRDIFGCFGDATHWAQQPMEDGK